MNKSCSYALHIPSLQIRAEFMRIPAYFIFPAYSNRQNGCPAAYFLCVE